jgi:hypothetical protein
MVEPGLSTPDRAVMEWGLPLERDPLSPSTARREVAKVMNSRGSKARFRMTLCWLSQSCRECGAVCLPLSTTGVPWAAVESGVTRENTSGDGPGVVITSVMTTFPDARQCGLVR